MTEKILIVFLSLIFLGSFITRNLIVKARTGQPVRAADAIVKSAIIFTGLCLLTAIFSTASERFYQVLGVIQVLRSPLITFVGLFLFAISIIMGFIFSSQMKESWRVGIHENQKTQLIQGGIYHYVRNPYFVSYFILFIGLFFVRPSFIMLGLVLVIIVIFHVMVLKEEAHLLKMHGADYEKYKEVTGRYFPRFVRKL